MKRSTGVIPALSVVLIGTVCFADEGMWTFDNPPRKQLQQTYNFTPTQPWLDHIRLSSVRLNDGGSGSFVSPHGLLLTNHHVARGQLQKNSTAGHDYIKDGFYAQTLDQEMKSPDLEVNVLVSMENVTGRVLSSMNPHMTEKEAFGARKSAIAQIERESTQKTGLRSDVISLYQGGEYWLYRYKKYTDVRLVFAPEQQTAFFGGDPDNFTYPRYDLDMAIFRVYENGKPIDSDNYLKWNSKGAADNELVFVSGNPGSTQRLDTMAQLLEERDSIDPNVLNLIDHRLGALRAYSGRGSEQARQAGSLIFNLENSRKAYKGGYEGLLNPKLIAKKQAEENEFRAKVDANAQWKQELGTAWEDIAKATAKSATRVKEQFYLGPDSRLAQMALQIVRYTAEIKKPDGERLPGYHDSQLESLRYELLSSAPIYPEMEIARLIGGLDLERQELGPDSAGLKAILDGRSPADAAKALVEGTNLADPAVRKHLLEGGQLAVEASKDSMIVMARRFDPIGRELIKWTEDNVESVEQRAGEKLGKARFLAYGKTKYPDATFTLRLAYGTVKGYPMNGTQAPYKTTLFGLYDRAASFDYEGPWYLPSRWKEGQQKLDLSTPLNFVNTCDIIGGNSGSPVINRNGDLVGLIFDGNIESLVADFIYESEKNRAVAVHTGAMMEALRKLYNAGKLADELEGLNNEPHTSN
ncbi:MAG TPA: S46 family peptidase [Bryobacteraceae bacterium]